MTDQKTGPASDDPFTYTTPQGAELTVPSLTQIKAGIIRKAAKLDAGEQVFYIIENVCDADALDAVDEMLSAELGDFMEAWQEHSGATVGE